MTFNLIKTSKLHSKLQKVRSIFELLFIQEKNSFVSCGLQKVYTTKRNLFVNYLQNKCLKVFFQSSVIYPAKLHLLLLKNIYKIVITVSFLLYK